MPAPSPPASATTPPWRSPLFWLLAWALASTASRVLLSQALMWDQAEQTVWSQQLAWGYGPQPPLYTWLQWAVNGVLGPTVLALALVKKTLMVLTFVFMFLAARQLMPAPAAWLAALGMWWLPGMGWQALRDLTHTVLLTCLVAATWWLLLRQLRRPSPGGFAALGLALGLGVLSKYSYVLFAGAALVAALSLPQPRRALLSRGWWLAPLIAALLVAPHALWVLQHWQEASSSTLAKLRPAYEATGWRGMLAGLGDLLTMLGLAALPWALMAWWAFGRRAWRTPAPSADTTPPWAVPLLLRYLGLIACGLLAMVVLGNVSNFDGRWIHPLVCMAPMAAFAWRPGLGDRPRGRRQACHLRKTPRHDQRGHREGGRRGEGLGPGLCGELHVPVLSCGPSNACPRGPGGSRTDHPCPGTLFSGLAARGDRLQLAATIQRGRQTPCRGRHWHPLDRCRFFHSGSQSGGCVRHLGDLPQNQEATDRRSDDFCESGSGNHGRLRSGHGGFCQRAAPLRRG